MGSSDRILRCPKCNYTITEYEHRMATYDYPCPRCEEATFSEFFTKAELLSIEVANNHPEWFEEEE